MSSVFDFIGGSFSTPSNKNRNPSSLCYAYPELDNADKLDSVITTTDLKNPRKSINFDDLTEDGLYADFAEPLTKTVVKPYQVKPSETNSVKRKPSRRNLEIVIREVRIHPRNDGSGDRHAAFEVTSVALLYKKKIICKTSSPFNRQLYKLMLRDPPDSANLSIQVQARDGSSSILPLPLPRHNVSDGKIEIDFSITTVAGFVYSGTVVCTFSLTIEGDKLPSVSTVNFFPPTNDPNDPRNSISICRSKSARKKKAVDYFSLDHPALEFRGEEIQRHPRTAKKIEPKKVEDVVVEHASFTLGEMSLRRWFQARHPLRPSSGLYSQKLRGSKKEVLVVTVLRGVEVPVREESALVQPLLEIEWGDTIHTTTPADGPVPIWHQTFRFEIPERGKDQSVKLRLYDQHPVWGLRWLGEALIPMEIHCDYEELERWVGLSPLSSPVLSFGYVQPSPGHSYTRLYVLMKMENPGSPRTPDGRSIDVLSRAIQRCIIVPYKLEKIDNPLDASRLAMLLPLLPLHYGPLTPKQALTLNKVDHFGRAALLASLLRGLGLHSTVVLGSSQTRKLAAYVVTVDENTETVMWDPENGDHYSPGDSRCSLIKVLRLINHQNIWINTQPNMEMVNLKYDVKLSKNWRPVGRNIETNDDRPVQTLELNNVLKNEDEENLAKTIERHLREKISEWRSVDSLTTTWNRHAATILRGFLLKFNDLNKTQPDKKELKQLRRAYYTHGFVVNLRHSSLEELAEQIMSTKIHKVFGPVEFALACHVQRYIGNAHSLWLGILTLRNKE